MEGIEAGGVPVFAVWRSPAAEWAERAAAFRRRVSSRLDCDERKRPLGPLGPVVTGKIGTNDLADSSIDQVGNVDTSIYTCSEFSPWVVSQVMKRFMVVHASKAEIGEEVFAHLRRIVPGESSTTFHAKLRDDSAEYAEVLRTLQEAGCVARGWLIQNNYWGQ